MPTAFLIIRFPDVIDAKVLRNGKWEAVSSVLSEEDKKWLESSYCSSKMVMIHLYLIVAMVMMMMMMMMMMMGDDI